MARILSGIQPSGTLHLGNYFAMMKRMIEFQNDNELFCFIVNYHAMTTVHDGGLLRLAAGCRRRHGRKDPVGGLPLGQLVLE